MEMVKRLKGGGAWEVNRKEIFEVRAKTGKVSYNRVRSIYFVLGNVISDMKCCKGQSLRIGCWI